MPRAAAISANVSMSPQRMPDSILDTVAGVTWALRANSDWVHPLSFRCSRIASRGHVLALRPKIALRQRARAGPKRFAGVAVI